MAFFIIAIVLGGLAAATFWASTRSPLPEGVASGHLKALAALFSLLAAVAAFASTVRVVEAGTVQVETFLGGVTGKVIRPGAHVVNPLSSWHAMNTRLENFNFTGGSGFQEGGPASALSSDGVRLIIDTQFSFRLQPDYADRVFEIIGPGFAYRETIGSAAREALRDAVAQFEWAQAATTGREELAVEMRQLFEAGLVEKLEGAGFTDIEANEAFQVAAVDLRRVDPPQIVVDANSQEAAALEELQRQETLTQIATEQANRRGQEGAGVANLFGELPEGFTAEEIASLLHALAARERAEALTRAVESGQVNVIVMDGGSGGSLTLPR